MKKVIKFFCWLLLGFCFFGFLFVRFAERQLVKQLPNIFQSASSPNLTLTVKDLSQGHCWLSVCVKIEHVIITPKNHPSIRLEKVFIRIPPLLPIRAEIRAHNGKSGIIDATISKYIWDIRSFTGNIENFDFDLSGRIDLKKETGELSLKTRGLRQFLSDFTDIPKWMNLLIQNTAQEFILKPKNGFLYFQGFPIFNFAP